ncbi:MAG TPA: class I SAM-dependent methyltransferase [Gemmatimonadales bacterium]|nr:class I SAM-dependent methyltransferase [Gemmatimonadales bacterium]
MDAEPLDDVMRRAAAYDRSAVVREYQALAQLLASAPPVLDLGCGSGTLLESLGARGVEATGVDASPSAIAACQAQGFTVTRSDLFDFLANAPAEQYGGVFAGHVVEHMPPDSARKLFAEVHRVLRPGGQFVLLTPNARNLYVIGQGFWTDPTHVRPYPPQLLRALASDAGFSSMTVRGWTEDLPLRQKLSGWFRWLATGGLHQPASTLLAIARR